MVSFFSLLYFFSEGWNGRRRSPDSGTSFSSGGGEKEQPGCAHTSCTLCTLHTSCTLTWAHTSAHLVHLVHLSAHVRTPCALTCTNLRCCFGCFHQIQCKKNRMKPNSWWWRWERAAGLRAHLVHLAHTWTKLFWLFAAVLAFFFLFLKAPWKRNCPFHYSQNHIGTPKKLETSKIISETRRTKSTTPLTV